MKSKRLIYSWLPVDEMSLKKCPSWIKDKVSVLNSISLAKCPFPIKVAVFVYRFANGKHWLRICSYLTGRHRTSGKWARIRTSGKPIHKADKPKDIIKIVHKDMKHLLKHEFDETFQLKTKDGITIPFDPHK